MKIKLITRRTLLAIATIALSFAWSVAAIADTGQLQINVSDAEGNPVAGAQVSASTPDSLTRRSGVTDENGQLRLMGLEPSDQYTVTVNAEGYQGARNEGGLVVSEKTLNIPFVLAIAGEEVMEEFITGDMKVVGRELY